MPNHAHVLIEPIDGHTLPRIVHSWKSFTAKNVAATGRLWQPDYYDRYIRNGRHLAAAVTYIESNPVKAGLCAAPEDWPFSSAAGGRNQ